MNHSKSVWFLALYIFNAGTALATDAASDQGGVYVGAFGGLGTLGSTNLQQIGTVKFPKPLPNLPIDADGNTDSPHSSLVGVQLGYEWAGWRSGTSGWGLKPAAELEGLYLGKHSPRGEMPIQPKFLGTQYVTIPMRANVLLANVVLTVETPYSKRIFPYAGVGAGMAQVAILGADSANRSEPGINHFNSDPDASDSAFALQFRLGIKGKLNKRLSLFTEYRYLSIDATRYTFGQTNYPGQHPSTEPWDVRLGRLGYNLFVVGLQYRF